MKEYIGIALMMVAAFLASFGALFLKKASALSLNPLKIIKNKFLFIGFGIYGLGTAVAIPAYKFAELSLLYPFIATSYVWTCLLSSHYLKEKMNVWKWSGIGMIIIGVSLIGIGH